MVWCSYLGSYGLFIRVWSFHSGRVFSFGYGVWVFFAIIFHIFYKLHGVNCTRQRKELHYAKKSCSMFRHVSYIYMEHDM